MVALFYFGSVYYIAGPDSAKAPVFNWKEQMQHISTVFGNTVFVFIYHHSIPGIIYPVRPQTKVKSMFLYANIIGAILLGLEG